MKKKIQTNKKLNIRTLANMGLASLGATLMMMSCSKPSPEPGPNPDPNPNPNPTPDKVMTFTAHNADETGVALQDANGALGNSDIDSVIVDLTNGLDGNGVVRAGDANYTEIVQLATDAQQKMKGLRINLNKVVIPADYTKPFSGTFYRVARTAATTRASDTDNVVIDPENGKITFDVASTDMAVDLGADTTGTRALDDYEITVDNLRLTSDVNLNDNGIVRVVDVVNSVQEGINDVWPQAEQYQTYSVLPSGNFFNYIHTGHDEPIPYTPGAVENKHPTVWRMTPANFAEINYPDMPATAKTRFQTTSAMRIDRLEDIDTIKLVNDPDNILPKMLASYKYDIDYIMNNDGVDNVRYFTPLIGRDGKTIILDTSGLPTRTSFGMYGPVTTSLMAMNPVVAQTIIRAQGYANDPANEYNMDFSNTGNTNGFCLILPYTSDGAEVNPHEIFPIAFDAGQTWLGAIDYVKLNYTHMAMGSLADMRASLESDGYTEPQIDSLLHAAGVVDLSDPMLGMTISDQTSAMRATTKKAPAKRTPVSYSPKQTAFNTAQKNGQLPFGGYRGANGSVPLRIDMGKTR